MQNGKLPQFLPENVIGAVFDPDNMLQSLINLREGLEKVGIFQVANFIFRSVIYVNIYNPPPQLQLTADFAYGLGYSEGYSK